MALRLSRLHIRLTLTEKKELGELTALLGKDNDSDTIREIVKNCLRAERERLSREHLEERGESGPKK